MNCRLFYTFVLLLCLQGSTFAQTTKSAKQTNAADSTGIKLVNRNAALEAKITASVLRKKYNGDDAMEQFLYNIYFSRNIQIGTILLNYSDSPDLERLLTKAIILQDSIITKNLYVANGNRFVKTKLAKLDSIKRLRPEEKSRLTNFFLTQSAKSPEVSFNDNFNKALRKFVTDTVYYAVLYKDDIAREASRNTTKAIKNLDKKLTLTKDEMKDMTSLINRKEKALATIQYTFEGSNRSRDSLSDQISEKYDQLIDAKATKKAISLKLNSRFSLAIQYRNKLGLDKAQVDELIKKGAALEKKLEDSSAVGFNVKAYECANIPKILTDDQYVNFLKIAVSSQAMTWAKGDWADMKARGLAVGLDSVRTVTEILAFDVNLLVVQDRFIDNPGKSASAVEAVYATIPEALTKLRAARRYRNPTTSNTQTKPAFAW